MTGQIAAAVVLGLGVVLQLVAAYRVFDLVRPIENRRPWLLFAAILVGMAALDGVSLYQLIVADLSTAPMQVTEALTSLLKSVLIVVGVFGFGPRLVDITRSQKTWKEVGYLYQTIFEHLPMMLVFKDKDLSYRAVNPAFKRFLGKQDEALLGKKDANFFPRYQSNTFLKQEEEVIKLGTPLVQEEDVTGVEGKKWLQIIRTPVLDGDGSNEGLLFAAFDITDCKQHVAALEVQIAENQRAIEDLQNRAKLEWIIAMMGVHFINLALGKVDQELEQALQTIGILLEVDNCFVHLLSEDGADIKIIQEWGSGNNQELEECLHKLTLNGAAWWLVKNNQFDILHITHADQPFGENVAATNLLQTYKIKSFTAVPLLSEHSVIGYLSLVALRKEKQWPQEMLSLFKVIAELFASVLERKWEVEKLVESNQKVDELVAKLEQRNRENILVTEMENILLVCRTLEEAYPIIARYAKRLLPAGSGALYVLGELGGTVERVAYWGQYPPSEGEMGLTDCWGLRRGKAHIILEAVAGPHCNHLGTPRPANYICVPLVAGGETVGLLHLRSDPEGNGPQHLPEPFECLAVLVAEHIALTLANLTLKDELHRQAIRDPLTDLFNRRYMEETLERELRRAIRNGMTVGVIMIDLDGFKEINDQYGHDLGDTMLKALGGLMAKCFRGEDVACRYGGDEFTVILPESTLTDTWQRAEELREGYKNLKIERDGSNVLMPTLSIGVSAYPDHGSSPKELLLAADTAMFNAKTKGHDRVMIGQKGEDTN